MKANSTKTKGGRKLGKTNKEVQKRPASLAAPKPANHLGAVVEEKQADLPSLPGANSLPTHEEQPTFEGIFEQLQTASNQKSGVHFSLKETEFILNQWLTIERSARDLPSWIKGGEHDLPPEIMEYLSRTTLRGSEKAAIEKNKKWVALFTNRAWTYLKRLSGRFLSGQSGVEKEAADSIGQIIDTLLFQLEMLTSIESEPGKKSAKIVHENILKNCCLKFEANRKRIKRSIEYNKRGGKKNHTGHFSFQCELWAKNIFFAHEDWREEASGCEPKFLKFPIPMPKSTLGLDSEGRLDWEEWFFRFFKHHIINCREGGNEMRKQWANQSTHLKKKLIPSYWVKASAWREKRARQSNLSGQIT